jgi:hypothetical protein
MQQGQPGTQKAGHAAVPVLRKGSERKAAYQLNAARRAHSAVPGAEVGVPKVVVKRLAIIARGAIAGEVVIVERVAGVGPERKSHTLVKRNLLCQREVHILIAKTAIAGNALAGSEVILKVVFKSTRGKHRQIRIVIAERLGKRVLAGKHVRYAGGLELSGNITGGA